MTTCKYCGATLPLTEPQSLEDIIGNEHAKRAAQVALTGGHTIAFIGGPEAEVLAAWCARHGVTAFAIRPCPCGNYRHPVRECTCSPRQIARFRASMGVCRALAADQVIETSEPGADTAWVRACVRGPNCTAAITLVSASSASRTNTSCPR